MTLLLLLPSAARAADPKPAADPEPATAVSAEPTHAAEPARAAQPAKRPPSSAPKPPSLTADSLRAVARDAVETWRIAPGIVIAWVSPDGTGVVSHGASGDPLRPQVDEDTLFEVGSITKTVTGLLLADMVHRGEVRLDEPVSALLPELSGPAADLSLVALASHRSGLPRLPIGPGLLLTSIFRRGDPYRGVDADDVIAATAGVHTLGDGFAYSNLGAAVLGQALARRAEMPYPALATERILAPLGMRSFAPDGARAAGHGINLLPAPSWTFDGYAPAGGLVASGRGMARYLLANLDGSAPGAALAQSPVAATGPREQVGLAWMISERRGHTITWHNGGTGGFRSFIGFDRERGVGVVVLANAANSVDALGGWLLGTTTAPARPTAASPGLLGLGALVAWGVGLAVIQGRTPLAATTGWRRTLLGSSRADAAIRLVTVVVFIGFVLDLADLRGVHPVAFAGAALVAVALQVALLARAWAVPAPPPAGVGGWVAQAFSIAFQPVLLWAAWGSPHAG